MTLDAYLTRAGRGALVRLASRVDMTPSKLSKIRYQRQEATLREALRIQRETGGKVRAADLVVDAAAANKTQPAGRAG
jgi:hypothetical protein